MGKEKKPYEHQNGEKTEKMARYLCATRGVDPDGGVIIGSPDPNNPGKEYNPAWLGYAEIADGAIAVLEE